MGKSLKECKEELVQKWEECFDMKIEKFFNEKGIKRIWDDDTSVDEVNDMLDYAAIKVSIGSFASSLAGVIIEISQNPKKDEDAKKKNDTDFNVYDTKRQAFVLFGYSSYDEAFEEAKNYCLENGVKLSDVKVCQVYE